MKHRARLVASIKGRPHRITEAQPRMSEVAKINKHIEENSRCAQRLYLFEEEGGYELSPSGGYEIRFSAKGAEVRVGGDYVALKRFMGEWVNRSNRPPRAQRKDGWRIAS